MYSRCCLLLLSYVCTLLLGKEASKKAAEMLTHNAMNLVLAIEEVLYACERAVIKLSQSEMERLNLIPHSMCIIVYIYQAYR